MVATASAWCGRALGVSGLEGLAEFGHGPTSDAPCVDVSASLIARRADRTTPLTQGETLEQRFERRCRESAPRVQELRAWVDLRLGDVEPKTPLGQALGYLDWQWPRLTEFLRDPRMPLTNNEVESGLRTWVLNRKTWLFVGHELNRAGLAVRAADERLVREADRLVLLLSPPFESTAHDPGYIRAYPPGIRENGGQYTHAATWLGWAYVGLGDGERAERIFRILNPILRARTREESDRYRVEPYVLAGDVYGAPPWVDRGGWTWYTGVPAWAWRLGVEGILGLRKKEEGELRIDPCIPPTWKEFEAWVRMGEQRVHIVVENPDAAGRGVAAVTLDGARLDSNRVRLDPTIAGEHEVRVRLGKGGLTTRDRPHRDAAAEQPARS